MKLSPLFSLLYTAMFGPRPPKVQVGYCDQLDHMVVLIGNGAPSIARAMAGPGFPNGVIAIVELWAGDEELREICARIISGLPHGQSPCWEVHTAGEEGERIAQIMRQNPAYASLVYLTIMAEVLKFRRQPGFAERAQHWRTVRDPRHQLFGPVRRSSPGGIDDENAALYLDAYTRNGVIAIPTVTVTVTVTVTEPE